ncbi:MAG TPA: hypothetical protein VJV39_02635 [Dongiaceae bacterium]|nr:hypothetical protein [Dongiaceae bacterium]
MLRDESKIPERTPGRRLRHVIVVAGPSGAGKNALIEQLMWGEMQADVLAALQLQPREAFLVAELEHALWLPSLLDTPGERTPTMHYEMTHTGLAFGDRFEHDPALQILRMAETATIVNLRPPRDRLIRQWGAAHLKTCTVWQVRLAYVVAALAREIHRAICKMPRSARRPRAMWRAVVRWSVRQRVPHRPVGALYLQRDGLPRLYRSWDAFVRQAGAWTQLRQVDIQPDPTSPIGTPAMRWKIDQCADAPVTAGSRWESNAPIALKR